MKIDVLNIEGKSTSRKIDLVDDIFSIDPSEHSVYLDVKQYLAHQRQGTHKTKERSEIKGSTRKIKKQKGTGTARAGSIKNPLFVGGGRVFGPRPKKYSQKLNKKVKRLARKSVLTIKAKEKAIRVIEDFSFDKPKTKNIINILNALGLSKKTIFVLSDRNTNVHLSSRNLKNSETVIISELNTYKILRADNIVFQESAIESLEKTLTS